MIRVLLVDDQPLLRALLDGEDDTEVVAEAADGSLLERWLVHHLAGIRRPNHRKLIHRFATWEILPRLRRIAATKPVAPSSRGYAGSQIIYATRFLAWLAEPVNGQPSTSQRSSGGVASK